MNLYSIYILIKLAFICVIIKCQFTNISREFTNEIVIHLEFQFSKPQNAA